MWLRLEASRYCTNVSCWQSQMGEISAPNLSASLLGDIESHHQRARMPVSHQSAQLDGSRTLEKKGQAEQAQTTLQPRIRRHPGQGSQKDTKCLAQTRDKIAVLIQKCYGPYWLSAQKPPERNPGIPGRACSNLLHQRCKTSSRKIASLEHASQPQSC